MPRKTAGSGCTTARLSIHGSRGPHPADRAGVHPPPQPHAGVGGGLARADDHVRARRSGPQRQVVDRHDLRAVDREPRRRLGRDVRGQIAGVHDPATRRDLVPLPGVPLHESSVAHVVAGGEQLDPASAAQPLQHTVVVDANGSRSARTSRPASAPRSEPGHRRARSTPHRRSWTPDAAVRTDTPRASDRPDRRGDQLSPPGRRRGRPARRRTPYRRHPPRPRDSRPAPCAPSPPSHLSPPAGGRVHERSRSSSPPFPRLAAWTRVRD